MLGKAIADQTWAMRIVHVTRARRWTRPQVDAVSATEIALTVGLAFQTAHLIWILAAPLAPLPAPPVLLDPPLQTAGAAAFDPFFRTGTQSRLAAATSDTSGGLRLFGLRAGGPGGGSAIIGTPDGRQRSIAVGEEIEPGLILAEVAPDFVTLARGAARSRLEFSAAPPPPPPPPPSAATAQVVTPDSAAAAQGPAIDAESFTREASLRPRMQGGEIRGFTLQARGNGQTLRAAGLQSGDVILEVNGMNMNSLERASELGAELGNAVSAEIKYERAGQVRTTTMRIDR